MKRQISNLNSEISKQNDTRLALEDKINSLEEQNRKLTRIIDAIM